MIARLKLEKARRERAVAEDRLQVLQYDVEAFLFALKRSAPHRSNTMSALRHRELADRDLTAALARSGKEQI